MPLTIALTYRNRDCRIVRNCLNSLQDQSNKDFVVILVNYGSEDRYSEELELLLTRYNFVKLISCPVQGQLWNKCRAINIALKKCKTDYFLVGDIDLIFHPDFIKIALQKASNTVVYFKYNFLSKEESIKEQNFEDFEIDFPGNSEITGTTLFPMDKLIEVNGYDEFYHGWGAEDTDIHIRLRQLGVKVEFYDEQDLIKHQWHPKAYRSKSSSTPYHSNLERINLKYMLMTEESKRTKVNLHNDWGIIPKSSLYEKLKDKPDFELNINSSSIAIASLFAQFKNFENDLVHLRINKTASTVKIKQLIKKGLNRKYLEYLTLEAVNNLLLEEIIKNYRNAPYRYDFDRIKGEINLTIFLKQ